MMRELRRLWVGLPVWLILAGTVDLNGVLAFYQRRYGPESCWDVVGQFWDKLGLPVPPGWGSLYLGRTLLALAACGLCERFRSLPIAFILVSVVLLFSALTADLKGEPLGLYVLANGFFAKLIRGRALTGWGSYSPPWGIEWLVWGPWHVGLTALCLYGAVRRRKEGNQW